MADPFVAEIRIFNFNFAPRGWAMCDGQILPLAQNTALFSLLGTMYGGDGRTNFALPNLQGCAPMHHGQGPGLTDRQQGEMGGASTVTLITSELPGHSHSLIARDGAASTIPQGSYLGTMPGKTVLGVEKPQPPVYAASPLANTLVAMQADSLSPAGGSQPHNNLQPYLAVNFCIALQGVFPPRG